MQFKRLRDIVVETVLEDFFFITGQRVRRLPFERGVEKRG